MIKKILAWVGKKLIEAAVADIVAKAKAEEAKQWGAK